MELGNEFSRKGWDRFNELKALPGFDRLDAYCEAEFGESQWADWGEGELATAVTAQNLRRIRGTIRQQGKSADEADGMTLVEVADILDSHDGNSGKRPMPQEKTIRIFLASSAELKEDRDAFDLYLRQQNDGLRKEGLYLQIVRWEKFLDAMSKTRLQDEYNKAVRNCDIFVSLFKTKTGKYTEEEFDVANETFKDTGKPLIYTYFREFHLSSRNMNMADLQSLQAFKDKLDGLGHFYTSYDNTEHLKRQFVDQLHELRHENRL